MLTFSPLFSRTNARSLEMTDNPSLVSHTNLTLEKKRGSDTYIGPDDVFAAQSLPNSAIPPMLRFLVPYSGDPSAARHCDGR
jgi:hypothetical protein